MAVGKKAKVFVRHIARQFVDKHCDAEFLESNLRKLYNAAILDLPDKELLKHLSNYADSYVPLLRKCIRKLLNDEVDRENSEDFPSKLPFNLYMASQSKVNKTAVRELPIEEQLQTYIQNLVNKLEDDDDDSKLRKTYKNFKSYLKRESAEPYMEVGLGILSSTTSTVAVASDVKARMMGLYLRGLEPIVKKCLAEQDVERAASVERKVKAFLTWSLIMKTPQQTMASTEAEMEMTVNITRNYLDLVLLSYRPSNQGDVLNLENMLYSFVTYVMDQNETHVLDILLRLKAVNNANRVVLQSLIKFALMQLPVLTGYASKMVEDYLQYMVAVAQFAVPLPQLRDIVENALNLPAPPGTVDFLKENVDMAEWPVYSKFQGKMVSYFLLKEAPDSVIIDIAKVLLEKGKEQVETTGAEESSVAPAFIFDDGPCTSKHQQLEEEGEEPTEDVDEIEDAEENARTAASRQKKKHPPESQDPDDIENCADDLEVTSVKTSVPKFVIDDSVPEVFDLSALDFNIFTRSSGDVQLPEVEKFPLAKGNFRYSPRQSSQSPEKPQARSGGGLSLSDGEEKDDSKPEFPKKMDIVEESENSDDEDDELCAPNIARHKLRGSPLCKSAEEEKEKGKDEVSEERKKSSKKPERKKRLRSPTKENGVHFSDLESGLKSVPLASPRKNRERKTSTSRKVNVGENVSEEIVHAEVSSSPVILPHLSNSDNHAAGKSMRKSTRLRNVSQSSTMTNQDEEEGPVKPLRKRHRNLSSLSTSSNGSILQKDEEEVGLILRSLRKRTFSSSSVGTNQSDVDAETRGIEAKVRAKARGKRLEMPVPDTLAEEEGKEEEDETSLPKGGQARGRGKQRKPSVDDGASNKEVELETDSAGRKSARKSAATPRVKRYALRSGCH